MRMGLQVYCFITRTGLENMLSSLPSRSPVIPENVGFKSTSSVGTRLLHLTRPTKPPLLTILMALEEINALSANHPVGRASLSHRLGEGTTIQVDSWRTAILYDTYSIHARPSLGMPRGNSITFCLTNDHRDRISDSCSVQDQLRCHRPLGAMSYTSLLPLPYFPLRRTWRQRKIYCRIVPCKHVSVVSNRAARAGAEVNLDRIDPRRPPVGCDWSRRLGVCVFPTIISKD